MNNMAMITGVFWVRKIYNKNCIIFKNIPIFLVDNIKKIGKIKRISSIIFFKSNHLLNHKLKISKKLLLILIFLTYFIFLPL